MPVITLKDCIFISMLPLSHWLSGKFPLPRQLVRDIGKMLEKIQNPGPSEKFPPDFPGPIFFPLTFPDFPGFPGCVATLHESISTLNTRKTRRKKHWAEFLPFFLFKTRGTFRFFKYFCPKHFYEIFIF